VDALVQQVRDLVDAGDIAGLADLTPPDEQGAALIEAAMTAAALDAADQAAQEVRDQGADVTTPKSDDLPAEFLAGVAALSAATLARDLAQSAARAAMQHVGPDVDGATVADGVRGALDTLTDAGPTYTLGGALSTAQNTGRVATFDAAPEATYYSSEVLDGNECSACACRRRHAVRVAGRGAAGVRQRRLRQLRGRPALPRCRRRDVR
jgi:hypothetical protein